MYPNLSESEDNLPFARKIEFKRLRYDKKIETALPERKKPDTTGIYLLPGAIRAMAMGDVDLQAKGEAGIAG